MHLSGSSHKTSYDELEKRKATYVEESPEKKALREAYEAYVETTLRATLALMKQAQSVDPNMASGLCRHARDLYYSLAGGYLTRKRCEAVYKEAGLVAPGL